MHNEWLKLIEGLVHGNFQAVHEASSVLETVENNDRTRNVVQTLQTKWTILQNQSEDRQLLYDTVAKLSKLEDPDEMLSSICEQVRRTFTCDVSYISILDESSDTNYTRTSVGDATIQFSTVEFFHGLGLGGMIMSTGRPYAATDYWADPNIRHDPAVDAIVKREGFVTMAGAPMIVDGKIIGVLFAAARSVRVFTQKELATLGALAMHAGPAFARALSIEELSEAHGRLLEATKMLEEERTRARVISDVHRELSVLVLDGAATSQICHRLGEVLSAQVWVVDSEPDAGATPVAHIPIGAGGRQLGFLAVSRDEALDTWERELCERGALVLAWIKVRDEAQAASDEQVRGELLEDVMLQRSLRSFTDRARRLGAGELAEGGIALVIIPPMAPQVNLYYRKTMQVVKYNKGLVLNRGGRIIVLLPSHYGSGVISSVAESIFNEIGRGYAGQAGPANSYMDFSQIINEATMYAEAAQSLRVPGRLTDGESLGFIGMHISSQTKDPWKIIDHEIGNLLKYDAERSTELVTTVKTYFDVDFHATRAAENLMIHPKTMAQRLRRVDLIIGAGWATMPRALQVGSAIHLYHAAQSGRVR